MTPRERILLVTGLLIGAVVAVSIVIGRQHVVSRQEPTAVASGTSLDTPAVQPDTPSSADSAAAVELSEQEQKAIGVETAEVRRQTIRKEIVAPGKVVEPETGVRTISARIGGRIEKLLINITGETVDRAQPVALIYSPEVFTAGEEYRLALENRQRLGASKEPQAISDADELVRASRRRLELCVWNCGASARNRLRKSRRLPKKRFRSQRIRQFRVWLPSATSPKGSMSKKAMFYWKWPISIQCGCTPTSLNPISL